VVAGHKGVVEEGQGDLAVILEVIVGPEDDGRRRLIAEEEAR
jgi:hypothetical protein